jgi:tRNA threonylcarbamoyladenosine biosynthesis protein TsaE
MGKQTIEKIETFSERETQAAARWLWKEIEHFFGKEGLMKEGALVIALKGQLGAGKTVFAQAFLKAAGVKGPFNSPTFVIMKKYEIKSQKKAFNAIYHFDCYRVKAADLESLGWEEIIFQKENIVLLEWPEKAKGAMPGQYLEITFSGTLSFPRERKLTFSLIERKA